MVSTNTPGDTVFFGPGGQGSATDVFQAIKDLRDGLNTNNTVLIQSAYNNLQSMHSRWQNTITDIGGRQAALEQLQETVGGFNTSLQAIQDTYEAVDYPSAITAYQKEGISQQASLSTLARSNQQNLFNYLT